MVDNQLVVMLNRKFPVLQALGGTVFTSVTKIKFKNIYYEKF